jgi:hypothetical protein
MIAAFEDELRAVAQNPAQMFSPSFTVAFFAQRLLSVLFWFIVSLGLTTLAPGAVSRAIERFQLSTLKVIGLGFATFLLIIIGVLASFKVLPDYLSAIVGLMTLVLLLLAYLFGRVAIQVSVGKLIQKYVFGERFRSEALAILIGAVALTILLSIPYVWVFALLALFAGGVGLVATARTKHHWRED